MYERLDLNGTGFKYCFGDRVEQRLINCVKNGDGDGAACVVSEVFSQIKSDGDLSYEYLCVVMSDMTAAVLKANAGRGAIERLAVPENILRNADIDVLQQIIQQHIREVCLHIMHDFDEERQILVDNIKKYIEINYNNPNMYVASIGEAFDISSAYLSKKFKLVTGEPLAEYISRYRIKKAKELMRMTNHNRDAIAAMVGLGHSRTFNRLFKKYEGITPTEYKEKLDKLS